MPGDPVPCSKVYVRALCPDGKWRAVLAEDLDERSFKLFVLFKLAQVGVLVVLNGAQFSFSARADYVATEAGDG